MADGNGAVDADSAAEWKPVASAAETRCAPNWSVESKQGRQPRGGYPRPTLGCHAASAGLYSGAAFLFEKSLSLAPVLTHGNSSDVGAFLS